MKQQGAAGLSQLIPPGLLPGGAASILPAADTTPRFHDFRILSQTQVLDPDIKESLGKLLGDKDSFDNAEAIERNKDQLDRIKATGSQEANAEVLDQCDFELALAHLRVPEMA